MEARLGLCSPTGSPGYKAVTPHGSPREHYGRICVQTIYVRLLGSRVLRSGQQLYWPDVRIVLMLWL